MPDTVRLNDRRKNKNETLGPAAQVATTTLKASKAEGTGAAAPKPPPQDEGATVPLAFESAVPAAASASPASSNGLPDRKTVPADAWCPACGAGLWTFDVDTWMPKNPEGPLFCTADGCPWVQARAYPRARFENVEAPLDFDGMAALLIGKGLDNNAIAQHAGLGELDAPTIAALDEVRTRAARLVAKPVEPPTAPTPVPAPPAPTSAPKPAPGLVDAAVDRLGAVTTAHGISAELFETLTYVALGSGGPIEVVVRAYFAGLKRFQGILDETQSDAGLVNHPALR